MAEESFREDRLREERSQHNSAAPILMGKPPDQESCRPPPENGNSQSQPTLMGAPPTREQMELLELGRALAIGSSVEYGSKFG